MLDRVRCDSEKELNAQLCIVDVERRGSVEELLKAIAEALSGLAGILAGKFMGLLFMRSLKSFVRILEIEKLLKGVCFVMFKGKRQ